MSLSNEIVYFLLIFSVVPFKYFDSIKYFFFNKSKLSITPSLFNILTFDEYLLSISMFSSIYKLSVFFVNVGIIISKNPYFAFLFFNKTSLLYLYV